MNELQSKRPRRRIGRVRFWIVMLVAALAVAFAYGGAALVGTRRADAGRGPRRPGDGGRREGAPGPTP